MDFAAGEIVGLEAVDAVEEFETEFAGLEAVEVVGMDFVGPEEEFAELEVVGMDFVGSELEVVEKIEENQY